jgi:hypothetical protein
MPRKREISLHLLGFVERQTLVVRIMSFSGFIPAGFCFFVPKPKRRLCNMRIKAGRSHAFCNTPLGIFLRNKFNQFQGTEIEGVSEEVMARLKEYEYPRNVRELENIIEQAFVLCRGRIIELHHLPSELRPISAAKYAGPSPMSLESMEKLLIREALHRHKGNRTKAASRLGINPSTLYRKMKALDINSGDENR